MQQIIYDWILGRGTVVSWCHRAEFCSKSQWILSQPKSGCVLLNLKAHKSTLLVPILSQMPPVHAGPVYIFHIHVIVIVPCVSRPSKQLFPSGSLTKILCAFLCASMHATWPTDLIVIHWITLDNPNIWLALQISELLLMQFSPAHCYFFTLKTRFTS